MMGYHQSDIDLCKTVPQGMESSIPKGAEFKQKEKRPEREMFQKRSGSFQAEKLEYRGLIAKDQKWRKFMRTNLLEKCDGRRRRSQQLQVIFFVGELIKRGLSVFMR